MDSTRETDSATNNLCYVDVSLRSWNWRLERRRLQPPLGLRGKSRQSIGSRSGPQAASVLPKWKFLSRDRCRRRASSFWPVGANPAEALTGHGDAWRFVLVQE